jgi:chromosome segregation ATPase
MIKSEWFSVNKDGNIEEKYDNFELCFNNFNNINDHKILEKFDLLEKRIETCENNNKEILKLLDEMKKNIEDMKKDDDKLLKELENLKVSVKKNDTTCNLIKNENLKLINRILETEVSIERTTNILLRKGISFPFTKINL